MGSPMDHGDSQGLPHTIPGWVIAQIWCTLCVCHIVHHCAKNCMHIQPVSDCTACHNSTAASKHASFKMQCVHALTAYAKRIVSRCLLNYLCTYMFVSMYVPNTCVNMYAHMCAHSCGQLQCMSCIELTHQLCDSQPDHDGVAAADRCLQQHCQCGWHKW